MTTLVEKVEIVRNNVINNRKNVAAQLESLGVQQTSAAATVDEMDALRALLEVALENAEVVAAAEARLESNKAVIAAESAEA